MKNKFLYDWYVKVSQLLGIPTKLPDSHTELKGKMNDKVEIFNSLIVIIEDQIECKRQQMHHLSKYMREHEKTKHQFWELKDAFLKLKREKIELEIERYSKADFVTNYQNRIKFYEEYSREVTEECRANLQLIVNKLSAMPIPDDSKDAALLTGMLQRHKKGFKTQQEANTLYLQMKDYLLRYAAVSKDTAKDIAV